MVQATFRHLAISSPLFLSAEITCICHCAQVAVLSDDGCCVLSMSSLGLGSWTEGLAYLGRYIYYCYYHYASMYSDSFTIPTGKWWEWVYKSQCLGWGLGRGNDSYSEFKFLAPM